MTYLFDNKQLVAIASGSNILVFRIDGLTEEEVECEGTLSAGGWILRLGRQSL